MKTWKNLRKKSLVYLAFALLGLVGAFAMIYSTRWGAIVYSDSTAYILSARSLLAGKGLGIPTPGGSFQPLTHFPPFYPLVLTGLGLIGMDPLEGARWLNVMLFGGMIVLVCGSVYHFSHRFVLSFLLGLVILSSPLFLSIFSRAMSEALFFFLGLLSLILLAEFLHNQRRGLLIGAGIAVGLASLTRYIGFTLVLCGVLLLLVASKMSWRSRLVNAAIFLGLAGILSAIWLVPVFLKTQQFAARSFQLSGDLITAFREAKVSLIDLGWSWVPFTNYIDPLPSYSFRGWFMIALVVFLGITSLIITFMKIRSSDKKILEIEILRLPLVFTLYGSIYLLFITFSFLFSTPRNDLDGRLLSPVYLSLLLIIFPLVTWDLSDGKLGRWFAWIPALIMGTLVVSGFVNSIKILQDNHLHGSGYTGEAWKNSEVIKAIQGIDQDTALISNESSAVLFLTGRPAYDVNERFLSTPAETYARYGEDPEDPAQRLFKTGQAVLVIFPTTFYWQLFPIYGDRTQARLDGMLQGLDITQRLSDGVIYRYATP
jgi:4-amino-4-deoxy-L-arabinose transferase-like glycosyltransferase